jgi:alkylated DNA repair dioxygenase AlkB
MNKIVVYSNGQQQLIYYPDFFERSYFDLLQQELPWQQNEIRVFGKIHKEPRLTCWFGPAYQYSSIRWPEAEFPSLMHEIRSRLTKAIDFPFNAVLANYYRSGDDSMGWHSDNEPEMDRSIIASVTFGGKRAFRFRNRLNGQTLSLELHDRSLLLMVHMQDEWQHAIPKTKRPVAPRINLTFRRIQRS